MRRYVFALLLGTFAVTQAYSNPKAKPSSPCKVEPGASTVNIPLVSNSLEPECQPARIRVNDRAPVTLHLTNISPLEVCTVAYQGPDCDHNHQSH